MPSYTVAQVKNELSQLLNRVETGEDVVITRRGVPIATIKSIETERERRVDEVFERMRKLREQMEPLQITSVQLLNDMYEERD